MYAQKSYRSETAGAHKAQGKLAAAPRPLKSDEGHFRNLHRVSAANVFLDHVEGAFLSADGTEPIARRVRDSRRAAHQFTSAIPNELADVEIQLAKFAALLIGVDCRLILHQPFPRRWSIAF